jgi:hypothetical protein
VPETGFVGAKVKTHIVRSEFFEDREVLIGSHTTPEEILALLTWLQGNLLQTHNEDATRRAIDKYCERGRTETRYKEDAARVLRRADELRSYIRRNDLHGSIYAAMLLQQDYIRLVLRLREADATTGRIFRSPKHRKSDQLSDLMERTLMQMEGKRTSTDIIANLGRYDEEHIIQEIDAEEGIIYWRTSGKDKTTTFKSFENRLSSIRKKIHK